MPDSPEAYLEKQSLRPVIAELLEDVCRSLPSKVEPYIIAKLCEKFPTAVGKNLDVPAEAKAWEPSTTVVHDKLKLKTYLEDLRWGSVLAALMERVIFERPKNAISFIIELLVKGDVAPALGYDEDAATLLQAAARGRKSRKEAKQSQSAATKVQAARRGKKSRQQVSAIKEEKEQQGRAATYVPHGSNAARAHPRRRRLPTSGHAHPPTTPSLPY